jgi:hypothetical protein
MAAPIITCPACTKKFKGKEGLEGKRIKCPLCATPFVVPGGAAEQVKAGAPEPKVKKSGGDLPIKLQEEEGTAPAAQKPQQRVTWDAADDNKDPYKLGDFDLRSRCPNCANLMASEDAVICVFCGYNTQTREWGQTVKAVAVTPGQHFLHLLPGLIFALMLVIFTYGLLFFCLELPRFVLGVSWAEWLDHESVRMWIIGISLAFMWAFATIAYRRLLINPKPKEREKQVGEN